MRERLCPEGDALSPTEGKTGKMMGLKVKKSLTFALRSKTDVIQFNVVSIRTAALATT